ncbi:MAG: vanadium-dependent haloperoxidase [Gemmatimonadaceae bacterium]
MNPLLKAPAVLALAVALVGCAGGAGRGATPASDADALHSAAEQLTSVIVYDIFSPPQASRVYAYASIAAYEVLRQGDTAYRSLAGQVRGLAPVPAPPSAEPVSLPLAGVHAFMTVGRALTFSQSRMDTLRNELDARFRQAGVTGAEYDRSIEYGERVAQHILQWSNQDNYRASRSMPKFSVTREAGRWIPTPPAYMDAVEPNWGSLRPFVLDSASQFQLPAPVPFDSTKGSAFYRQTQEVYDTGRGLTEEQRLIAAFWDCNPYVMHVQGHTMFATKKITPGGHWMGIARIAARKSGADITRAAEIYARLGIALSDGFLSAWAEKYRTNVVRPETVVNRWLDPKWEPLLQTPPFPEYPSAHSVISTAASAVLSAEYGEQFAFVDSTEIEFGLPSREFKSFAAAAKEAAISRLYGGIHFRGAIEQGEVQGRQVGALVLQRIHTRGRTTVAGANRSGRGSVGSANPAAEASVSPGGF